MPRCVGSKPDGGQCTRIVGDSNSYCYAHDPNRAEERRRHAKRGGRGKLTEPMKELRGLKKQLEDLAEDVLEGRVERGDAVVVNQILNTRARLIELERKIKETEELEERIEALEGGQAWGA
jgi:hypothetical protein